MPALIDSAPDCISHEQVNGLDQASIAASADDSADFVLQNNYLDCNGDTAPGGIMTFGPGTVYGEGGSGANGAYYALTWIGIFVTIAVLLAWMWVENKRLINYVRAKRG